jgi:UDP-N-acetylglucosamine 2-epimerase (non-hydrolysing)
MPKKKFTLVTFLGIRPDIIRTHKLLALLDRGQARHGYRHIYVHSGQHFDYQLDGIFYRQLGVRRPDLNLRTGRMLKKSGKMNHVYQSALLFTKTAQMLEKLRPDAVLYLGDTNTVLSSLIVAKYGVQVIHIEGGGRSFDWRMPEEKNRIIADHLSDAIYCYLDRYRQILLSEGIPAFRVAVVGNVIVDAVNSFLPMAEKRMVLQRLGVQEKQYVLCTLHREENLESAEILDSKLRGLRELSMMMPVVFPLMPRLDAGIKRFGLQKLLADSQLILTKPLGYLEFLKLEKHARMIITDSGTVQEEALILGVPCVVTRRSTERPETIAAGATILADEDLVTSAHRALDMDAIWDRNVLNPMGGSPSERIYQDLVDKIRSGFFSTSRNFDMLSGNRFARQAYGLDLQNTSSSFRSGSAVPELSLMNSF